MRSLKQRLVDRELTIGSWLSFGYTPVTEMMAKAGFDWLVVDMEHTAIDIWQAPTSEAGRVECVNRRKAGFFNEKFRRCFGR